VRNLADRCDTFVEEWTERIAALRANPIGDKYDLSQHREVIGVVCLPFVPFCRIGPGVLRVRVRDDGIGGADSARGSGLLGLKDRIETLGGTFSVHRPVGRGTTVTCEVPVTAGSGLG